MGEFLAKIDEIEELCKLLNALNQELERLKGEMISNSNGLTWEAREFRKRKEELDGLAEHYTTIYTLLTDKVEKIILFRASLEKVDAKDWEELLAAKGYDENTALNVLGADAIMDVIKDYEAVKGEDKNGKKSYTLKEIEGTVDRVSEIKEWSKKMRLNAGSYDLEDGLSEACGDPINAATGNFIMRKSDLYIEGFNSIEFARFYNSIDLWEGSLGKGWHHSYEVVIKKEI
jgi:broad-specificity NMP kinase